MRSAAALLALWIAGLGCTTAQDQAQDVARLRAAAASAEARQDYGTAADRFLELVAADPHRAEWAVAGQRGWIRERHGVVEPEARSERLGQDSMVRRLEHHRRHVRAGLVLFVDLVDKTRLCLGGQIEGRHEQDTR